MIPVIGHGFWGLCQGGWREATKLANLRISGPAQAQSRQCGFPRANQCRLSPLSGKNVLSGTGVKGKEFEEEKWYSYIIHNKTATIPNSAFGPSYSLLFPGGSRHDLPSVS